MAQFTDLHQPTPAFLAELLAKTAQLTDAHALVALAEEVAEAHEASLAAAPYQFSAAWQKQEDRREFEYGFDGPYTPANCFGVWRALVWMGLSDQQWHAVAEHWADGVLNPCAMSGPLFFKMPPSTAPIVMVCPTQGARVLTVLRQSPGPSLDFQIGPGTLDDTAHSRFTALVASRQRKVAAYGGPPPHRMPALALVDGAPYMEDCCQWANSEMREVEMRSERSLKARIWLQFVGREYTGYYVPL